MPTKFDLLDELTKEELLEVAHYYEIYAPSSWRKYEIIDTISSTFYKDQIEDIVDYWLGARFSGDEESEGKETSFKYKINYPGDYRSSQPNPNNIGLIVSPRRKESSVKKDRLPKLNKGILTRIILFLNLDNFLMITSYSLVIIWWLITAVYHPYIFHVYETTKSTNALLIIYLALIPLSLLIRNSLKASDSESMKNSANKLFLVFLGAILLSLMFVLSSFVGLFQPIFIYGQFLIFPMTINLFIFPAYEVFKVSETENKGDVETKNAKD